MNHKWKNNKCVHCGLFRIMKSWSRLMAIVNHPPWNVYKYGRDWYYGVEREDNPGHIKGIGFERPECVKKEVKKEEHVACES